MNPLAVRPTSIATINAALRARGIREEVVRGKDYFYFAGGRAAEWPSSSVYVTDTATLTIGGWINEWHGLSNKPLRPDRYGDHELGEVDSYTGNIKDGKPDADGAGWGFLWQMPCSCGWVSSWSHHQVAAINGGKAHIRAIRKKENV